jgi:hypothetical protein
MTLSIVCFKWKPTPGYRSSFGAEQVDTLRRMVRRHYQAPHRFICITDDPTGIREDVEIYRLWDDFGTLRNPSGLKNPSCYRRLRVFSRNAAQWIGDRFVCVDLDCVIVGDMRPLWDRPEDFVIWKSTTQGNPYNGSMFLNRSGTRPQLWEAFDPLITPRETKNAGYYGSDQAWIGYCLGHGEATWTASDGVHSYRNEIQNRAQGLPPGARIVFFHGRGDPWSRDVYIRHAWIRENYR